MTMKRAAKNRINVDGRQDNLFSSAQLKLSTTPQVLDALDALVAFGLHGKTRNEVAEGLIRSKLLEFANPTKILAGGRKPPERSKDGRKRKTANVSGRRE